MKTQIKRIVLPTSTDSTTQPSADIIHPQFMVKGHAIDEYYSCDNTQHADQPSTAYEDDYEHIQEEYYCDEQNQDSQTSDQQSHQQTFYARRPYSNSYRGRGRGFSSQYDYDFKNNASSRGRGGYFNPSSRDSQQCNACKSLFHWAGSPECPLTQTTRGRFNNRFPGGNRGGAYSGGRPPYRGNQKSF